MKHARYLICLLLITGAFGCKNSSGTRVVIYTSAPLNAKLYIERIPFFDEKKLVVDSATIVNNHDSLILFVPEGKEERLYNVTVKGQKMRITFVNDSRLVRIHVNYFHHTYEVSGSPATTSLINFFKRQDDSTVTLHKKSSAIDSLYKHHADKKKVDSLLKLFYAKLKVFQQQYVKFADTTKSPAAFVKVYNYIDYDTDYKGLKKFITANSARFPDYDAIKKIKAKAFATIHIYEEEFNVGDKLPSITLPDTAGNPFATSSLKGQYYLIDFWSTLCDQCMPFKIKEKELFEKKQLHGVKLVSVAIDDQKANWQSLVSKNKLNWTHLIDEKMWEGPAVQTLVFDSIPFNFLVAPNGRVIKKAIKPDSLSKVLSKLK